MSRLPLAGLLAGSLLLAGCAAPEHGSSYQREASLADQRMRQAVATPGYDLLHHGGAQRMLEARRPQQVQASQSSARSAGGTGRVPSREGPSYSASLARMQAEGKVVHEEPPALPRPVNAGAEVSRATGKPALLPQMFHDADAAPQDGFELGGRLLSDPEPGNTEDLDGAELEFRFLH